MTHLNTSSVQIPPDSSGKKLGVRKRTVIYYDNLQSGKSFQVGDTIVTASASAVVTGVNTAGFTSTAGSLYLQEVDGTFADNEQITVDTAYFADINTSIGEGSPQEEIYYQDVVLVDPDNPERAASFSDDNRLQVSLPDTTVSEAGLVTVSQTSPVATFSFDYEGDDVDLVDNEVTIKYTNGVGIGSGFTVGSTVLGLTSGARGIVKSTDTVNLLLDLEDCEGTFSDGETVQNMDITTTETCEVVDTATITIDSNTKSVFLSTGGTTDGVGAKKTSNYYVPLGKGRSTEVTFGVATTSNTPGVARRFGMFDEENGYYFEILESDGSDTTYDPVGGVDTGGETVLRVIHRTNSSGSVINHTVTQSNFNTNQLNGTDVNAFVIDFTRPNVFWIDIPNNGAGSARFGVYNQKGKKVVAHVFNFNNNATFNGSPSPFSAIPLRAEICNHGGGTPSQASTLKIDKVTVFRFEDEGDITSQHHGNAQLEPYVLDNTVGEFPLFGIRAGKLINGIKNRTMGRLSDISVSLLDDRIDREFDATAVSSNQIFITNHGYQDGWPVYYQNNGNTSLTGLTDYEIYYVIRVDKDTIKLASTHVNAEEGTALTISAGTGSHKIVGLADGPALIKIRKNSNVADFTWASHNADRSGSQWAQNGTGFRLANNVTIAGGGTGYTVGDLLELDSGIFNHREAVLKVAEVDGSGTITRILFASDAEAHLTELDGTSNANRGSYNGKISSAVGHKANGVGFSSTTGSAATFNVSVEWGHGFWWVNMYGQWAEFKLDELNSVLGKDHNFDTAFFLSHSEHKQTNLVVTGQVHVDAKDAHLLISANWTETV